MTRYIPIYAALFFLTLSHQTLAASASSSASSSSTSGVTVDLNVTGTGTASGTATVTVGGVTHTVSHVQVGPGSFHGHSPAALARDSKR